MASGERFVPNVPSRRTWVTRTAPFNRLTARHLKSAGFDPLLKPALGVIALSSDGPLAVPDALVFTSLQGVRHHTFFASLAQIPVFAVGGHSARVARLRGYQRVAAAWGDVHDLRELIRAEMPAGATIMHLSAAQPAGDLIGMLTEDGYLGRRRIVYETVETSAADLQVVAAELSEIGAILIHSPRAGRHVAKWLEQRPWAWSGIVCCISAAAAEPFKSIDNVRIAVARQPNEASLLDALISPEVA